MKLEIDTERGAYYRGEDIPVEVRLLNTGGDLDGGELAIQANGMTVASGRLDRLPAGLEVVRQLRVPTTGLKAGEYRLKAVFAGGEAVSSPARVYIGRRLNPDELMVWLWPHQAYVDSVETFNPRGREILDWWFDKGLTNFTFGHDADGRRFFDYALYRGMTAGISPNGGLREVDPDEIADPDARLKGLSRQEKIANPFHPEVARRHDEANREIMEAVAKYPNLKTAFFNTEIVDNLRANKNEAGVRMMKEMLGFTEADFGEPRYIAPGVIDDNDPRYLYRHYVFKHGNGLPTANERTAKMIHRYRPDILTINDPYRQETMLDAFPGVDVIGTWTYTNPDPKLMFYVETLRAACEPEGKIPLSTVTLLNYPGELAPTKEWMMMGPGRLKVTTWINLSRAPNLLGYYFSSGCDPFSPRADEDLSKEKQVGDFENPKATYETLKELSQKVFKPYGPLIRNLDVAPRKIAVLSSTSSRLYNKSPYLRGRYDNIQIYHFYTVLAMAHLQADVIFDEHVERFGLDAYDVLVLPKCDALTKTIYDKVLEFRKRGGTVIADQYLGPDIPGAIKFDFDFAYRENVNAVAIAENKIFADWYDQLKVEGAEYKEAKGVTALDDQKIMESFAARLKADLKGKVEPDVDCDEPTVLFNMLEKDSVKYLVVINDKRSYDDRIGQYKSVLGTVEPQTVTVSLKEWGHPNLHAYDMLARDGLRVRKHGGSHEFTVNLTELGGTIIALYPSKISGISVSTPSKMKPGERHTIGVNLKAGAGVLPGLQPVRVTITDPKGNTNEFSDYYCARNGSLAVGFIPALNDLEGRWTVSALDLTSGLSAEKAFTVAR